MKFNRTKVLRELYENNGNVPKAMVSYIFKHGCNGFRCKKCPLTLVCSHKPEYARTAALFVIDEVRKREIERYN